MFAIENISPQHPRQRSAESGGKGTVIDSDGHGVDGGPKCALGDDGSFFLVDGDPGLDYAAEEDCGADVRAGELGTLVSVCAHHFVT